MKNYKDYQKYASDISAKRNIEITKANSGDKLSFTPYIYNNCSASCKFCSEKLVRHGKVMVCDAPCEHYTERLTRALQYVFDRKIFLSLSGKEPSENVEQLEMISKAVEKVEHNGGIIQQRVMYSNLSGFTKEWERLISVLHDLAVSRIECSRHHYDENINQNIMRFKVGETIQNNAVFLDVVQKLQRNFSIKMVCVFQKSGVKNAEDVVSYLKFAKEAGVKEIVFRELAMFDDAVDQGITTEYIVENRVELMEILEELPRSVFHLSEITEGYYYYSFVYEYAGMKVYFEMSDYEEMIKHHNSSDLYKLIFYPNGKLCKDWNMQGEIDFKPHLEKLKDIARILSSQTDAVLIGSMATYITRPELLNHVPIDVDFYINKDIDNLKNVIRILEKYGYKVYSWTDFVDEKFDFEKLSGRFYLRGIKGNIMVDITYESSGFDESVFSREMIFVDGIRTLTDEGIMELLEGCDREETIERYKKYKEHNDYVKNKIAADIASRY